MMDEIAELKAEIEALKRSNARLSALAQAYKYALELVTNPESATDPDPGED